MGVWMLGQNYRAKKRFYGEYPPGFLARVYALFPEIKSPGFNVLQLFSGSLDSSAIGTRFDIRKEIKMQDGSTVKPGVVGDAHTLQVYFPAASFDLIIADPPYTAEDANRYGTCMVNRNVVLKQCRDVLKSGGFVVWLDQVLPMFRKAELQLQVTIGIIRSTNHRVRCLFIW